MKSHSGVVFCFDYSAEAGKKKTHHTQSILYFSLFWEFLRVKTIMGIKWFEVHFGAFFSFLRDSNES